MVGILIATHGNYGLEIVKSAELIIGKQNHYKALSLLHGDNIEDFKLKILNEAKLLDDGDGILSFVDLYGGSPFNAMALNLKNFEQSDIDLECIVGFNMAMVLEAFSSRSLLNLEELKIQCLSVGIEGIKDLKHQLECRK